jgi:hypothetical protein
MMRAPQYIASPHKPRYIFNEFFMNLPKRKSLLLKHANDEAASSSRWEDIHVEPAARMA